ncbi:SGNH/GDSL hydrolase family protein [Vibrio methylphosphonaticus]|uniref:SGNH/GDSL hydrolase family protein n=1 Tax=Vibrio methylphosphonaticus TaxID=2946866 RepID=UPI00202A8CDC|nr:GDSL-type esterase/lipase family protein [Vibrio methylphosphonaticus]MCL9776915.1 GDSL-type esterase/lipase family protein [Vibrio methylphosphonaticus]
MKKVALLGDSLTAGWGLKKGLNWSESLASTFAESQFINLGIPGDTTTGMLSRFQQQVIEQQPDVVVIFGGLNDLNWGTPINEVACNYNAMIAQAQHHNIRPIVIITSPIDPIGSLPLFAHQQETVNSIRDAIATLSSEYSKRLITMYGHGPLGIEVVDIYQAFEAYALEHGYSALYQDDGIHLSAVGAEVIFNQLKDVVAKLIA